MEEKTIRVLLVEDNPGDARLIQELLSEKGSGSFHLDRADRLDKGLERLASADADLVLLDLSLPDSQGLDTLGAVLAAAPQVPVIVLTGLDDEAVALEAVRRGAQDYLVKGQIDSGLLCRAARYATKRKQIERALRESEERFRDLAELLPETVFEADLDGRLTFANRNVYTTFGYTPEELTGGLSILDMLTPEDRPETGTIIVRLLAGEEIGGFERTALKKDGTKFPIQVYAARIMRQGRPAGIRGLVIDITERKRVEQALQQANRRLAELASVDEVTGIWNRRRFLEMLDHEFQRIRRHEADLSLVMIDLDHFKAVNDTHGHAFGDQVLREVAATLKAAARSSDIVARYGGDEFMVLMPDTDTAQAEKAAERIRAMVAGKELSDDPRSVRLTLSIGLATAEPNVGDSPDDLVRLADEALYAAKTAGRNAVRAWGQVCRDQQHAVPSRRAAIEKIQKRVEHFSQRSKEMFMESIQGLVRALEARDEYARSHSENVTRYAVGMAEAMGLDPAETEVVRRAAMIHDIGKIGVPDAILRKPAALTPSERRVMEQHALIGVRILENLKFLDAEIPIVRHHHERWDGSGYPDGAAGPDIPAGARILAVADAFDAITSPRVYRPARRVADALRILVEESGKQFDPAVVDALIRWTIKVNGDLQKHGDVSAQDLLQAAATVAG